MSQSLNAALLMDIFNVFHSQYCTGDDVSQIIQTLGTQDCAPCNINQY